MCILLACGVSAFSEGLRVSGESKNNGDTWCNGFIDKILNGDPNFDVIANEPPIVQDDTQAVVAEIVELEIEQNGGGAGGQTKTTDNANGPPNEHNVASNSHVIDLVDDDSGNFFNDCK